METFAEPESENDLVEDKFIELKVEDALALNPAMFPHSFDCPRTPNVNITSGLPVLGIGRERELLLCWCF